MRPKFLAAAFAVTVFLAASELVARLAFGLGTPPLVVSHPTNEYMMRPDQDVRRFGNRYIVNRYGMRSEPFEGRKTGLRILVFGDSVVNGGSQTDQDDLATSLVGKALIGKGLKNVTVGNISAGSWGPGNWLAYAREYGFFEADAVVLVISSHDYADNPTFAPLDRDHPSQKPLLALQELAGRYVPGALLKMFGRAMSPQRSVGNEKDEEAVAKGLADLRSFLRLAAEASPHVLVLQHLTRDEILGPAAEPGYFRIRKICEEAGLRPVSMEARFRESMARGEVPYRDDIHPNAEGQRVMAEVIIEDLEGL